VSSVPAAEAPANGGKREATKAANRAAILAAGREVFAELGFGAASVRDIIRRTGLASGTFYNYFPDKESVLREIVEDFAVQARARVQAARREATTPEEFVAGAYGAYFGFLAEDPLMLELLRRNGGTMRAMFDEPSVGAGTLELREDLEAAVARGVLAPHDTRLMAAAIMGAGLEVGFLMLDEERPDVKAAVQLLGTLFGGGFERLQHPGPGGVRTPGGGA
jgi:AcrR family transcriptional regulator